MQKSRTFSFFILIIIISLCNISFAQRNPSDRPIDNRLPERPPVKKIERKKLKEEKPVRERPKQTELPIVKNPVPPNNEVTNPPHFHPRPPQCYVPPYRPNPHPPRRENTKLHLNI